MPPTGFEHSEVTSALYLALCRFVHDGALGAVTMPETGFVISGAGDPETVLAPDLAFIDRERAPASSFSGFPRLAPDLAVEIASPSQHHPELAAKALLWLAAGTRLVWVIWPRERQVEVWEAGTAEPRVVTDELEGGTVLPGFRYLLRDLFPG